MNELLRLEDVQIRLRKGDTPIVKGVDLSVSRGRATVVVGESGSGKTMLIKAVTGILNRKNLFVGGHAFFEDTDLFALDEKARRVYCSKLALIMQNPMTAFDPSVRIGRQMAAGMKGAGSKVRERSIRALEAVGLPRAEQLLKAYPHELSGGMLQRVMIAIAMMSGAQMIAADEPTTALDVVSQGLVLDQLNILKSKGVGILLVTHDFGVAKKIADEIVVMRSGEFVECGEAAAVLNHPRHVYTKTLLEASVLHRRDRGIC